MVTQREYKGILHHRQSANQQPDAVKTIHRHHYREQPDKILRAQNFVGGYHHAEAGEKCLFEAESSRELPPIDKETTTDEEDGGEQRERSGIGANPVECPKSVFESHRYPKEM